MRLSRLETLSLIGSILLSSIFLNMFPVYLKVNSAMGITIFIEAVVSVFLFFFIMWGYTTLAEVMALTSIAVLFLVRPPAIYAGAFSISWWGISLLYLVIVITGILSSKPRNEKMLSIVSLFFTMLFLAVGFMIAYEGLKLPLPPDVLRGISAPTKIKTWRSMGVLLGLMNAGAAISMLRGKYLHYMLLISFTLPPLFTVPLSFDKITFGVFSQVLLLVQIGVSGLIISWYMGSKR